MNCRERFEKEFMGTCDESDLRMQYGTDTPACKAALQAWKHCERQFWPPKPTNLPSGWRVKGDEPRMVRPGEEFSPTTYFGFDPDEIKLKDPVSKYTVPIFVWELEPEVGCTTVNEYRYRSLTGSIGLEGP